jgi:hypothetical protein
VSTVKRSGDYASPDADADDGQTPCKKVARQPQFRRKAGDQIAADDAQRPGAENNETVISLGRGRDRASGRERPAIAEANVAAFELVLHQAEIVRFKMLQDAERFHVLAWSE